jgi:hypothetical protein
MQTQFKPTPEMVLAAEAVFTAKTLVLQMTTIVLGYQSRILAKHQWMPAKEWQEGCHPVLEPITNPKDSYLLEENDFLQYLELCNEARIAAGLHIEKPGQCPLLVAQDLERRATRNLFDVFEQTNKFSYSDILKSRDCIENIKRATSLMLSLMAPFVRPAKEILQEA